MAKSFTVKADDSVCGEVNGNRSVLISSVTRGGNLTAHFDACPEVVKEALAQINTDMPKDLTADFSGLSEKKNESLFLPGCLAERQCMRKE